MIERNWYLNEVVFACDTFETPTDCCSLAHVCPRCGVLWGREELIGRPWMAYTSLCELHGGGHLLCDFTLDQLANGHQWDKYSPKVLGYEVTLLLKERQNGRSNDITDPDQQYLPESDGSEGTVGGPERDG